MLQSEMYGDARIGSSIAVTSVDLALRPFGPSTVTILLLRPIHPNTSNWHSTRNGQVPTRPGVHDSCAHTPHSLSPYYLTARGARKRAGRIDHRVASYIPYTYITRTALAPLILVFRIRPGACHSS